MKELGRQGLSAFFWGAGGSIFKIILQLGTQAILARLLGPTEYGLFALGVIVVTLGAFFSDIGLAYGLIQKKLVSPNDIQFVWTWQCILGLSISSAIFFCAGMLASFFSEPDAEFIFQWLSLVILINALTAPATNLLRKNLNYKALQVSQLSSYFIGFGCIGIPLAIAGYDAASLVTAWLVHSVLNFIFLYLQVRHSLSFRLWSADGSFMLRYGATVLGTNLINWLLNMADKILIGRVFPAYTLGLYNTAFNLVYSPSYAIYGNLQSVVFSAGARLQDNHEALRAVFLHLLSLIILTAFPFFAIIGVGSEFVMVTVYGIEWLEASQFLMPFALVMPFLMIWGISTPILWNSGHTKLEFRLQIPLVLLWMVTFYSVADLPPQVIAIVAASLFALRCMVMVLAVTYILKISFWSFLQAVQGGIALTLIVSIVSALLVPSIAALETDASVQLLLLLSVAGIVYILSVYLFAPLLVDARLSAYTSQISDRLPPWMKPILRRIFGEYKK